MFPKHFTGAENWFQDCFVHSFGRNPRFVAKQPCLVCGRQPCDPHHLRFAQARGLGLKVSDEFTVPLCRAHHRELHRAGKELNWWARIGIEPLTFARQLWLSTHPLVSNHDATQQHNGHPQFR